MNPLALKVVRRDQKVFLLLQMSYEYEQSFSTSFPFHYESYFFAFVY
jgi:hypothetical protein